MRKNKGKDPSEKPFIVYPTEQIFMSKYECSQIMCVPIGVVKACLDGTKPGYKNLKFQYLDENEPKT